VFQKYFAALFAALFVGVVVPLLVMGRARRGWATAISTRS
jgi:hypothetical protein